ncbi:MAG: aspartate carbamoyltransferase regulatory subunit [Thermoproteota archaeon]|nr:MAG: aspartate carbamoyltransferase regulatory subunit [Candidatus Korarchaeota archaeon]
MTGSEGDEHLIVRKIEAGTVIDHIPAGRALDVLRILGITGKEGYIVAVVMNVPSRKLGKKDMVKIEWVELSQEQVDRIAIVAPSATINLIRNWKVVEKRPVELEDKLINILKCPNPNCITNSAGEHIKTSFTVKRRVPLVVACDYCGYRMGREEAISHLKGALKR